MCTYLFYGDELIYCSEVLPTKNITHLNVGWQDYEHLEIKKPKLSSVKIRLVWLRANTIPFKPGLSNVKPIKSTDSSLTPG